MAVGVVVGAVSLLLWQFDVFERAELATVDARFAAREDPANVCGHRTRCIARRS